MKKNHHRYRVFKILLVLFFIQLHVSNKVIAGNSIEKTDYILLLNMFPIEKQGLGYDPFLPPGQVEEQAETYGLILASESKMKNNMDEKRVKQGLEWLLMNRDLDSDKIFGWGLPSAWDAFGDGTTNPANTQYTITNALVMEGLVSVLENNKMMSMHKDIISTLDSIVRFYFNKVFTEIDSNRGYFSYSPLKHDDYFVPNVSSFFMGVTIRYLKTNKSNLSKRELAFVWSRIDKAASAIIEVATIRNSFPFWKYVALNDKFKDKDNDLVHHCLILFGIEEYRDANRPVIIPWTRDESLKSVKLFIRNGIPYDFPQDITYSGEKQAYNERPSKLWGLGVLMALSASFGDVNEASQIKTIIKQQYGRWPQLKEWPGYFSSNDTFYSRYAVFVLWGEALRLSAQRP